MIKWNDTKGKGDEEVSEIIMTKISIPLKEINVTNDGNVTEEKLLFYFGKILNNITNHLRRNFTSEEPNYLKLSENNISKVLVEFVSGTQIDLYSNQLPIEYSISFKEKKLNFNFVYDQYSEKIGLIKEKKHKYISTLIDFLNEYFKGAEAILTYNRHYTGKNALAIEHEECTKAGVEFEEYGYLIAEGKEENIVLGDYTYNHNI